MVPSPERATYTACTSPAPRLHVPSAASAASLSLPSAMLSAVPHLHSERPSALAVDSRSPVGLLEPLAPKRALSSPAVYTLTPSTVALFQPCGAVNLALPAVSAEPV